MYKVRKTKNPRQKPPGTLTFRRQTEELGEQTEGNGQKERWKGVSTERMLAVC